MIFINMRILRQMQRYIQLCRQIFVDAIMFAKEPYKFEDALPERVANLHSKPHNNDKEHAGGESKKNKRKRMRVLTPEVSTSFGFGCGNSCGHRY